MTHDQYTPSEMQSQSNFEESAPAQASAADLLAYLHRGGNKAYWWTLPDEVTYWRDVGTWTEPPARAGQNIYFGIHPMRSIPTTNARGEPASPHRVRSQIDLLAAVNCVFSEFDAKDHGGSLEATRAAVDALQPAPSAVIASGNGYHVYWLLDKPLILNSEEDRRRAEALQHLWVMETGGDGGAKDLARVLRYPGTLNYKYTPPQPVTLEYFHPETVYNLEYLESLVEHLSKPKDTSKGKEWSGQPAYGYDLIGRVWLEYYLEQAHAGNRDDTCLRLSQQLHYSRMSKSEAAQWVTDYAARVEQKPHAFTEKDALKCLNSAYGQAMKEPSALPGYLVAMYGGTKARAVASTNGNGHHPSEIPPIPEPPADFDGELSDQVEPKEKPIWLHVERMARALANEYGDAELMAELYTGRILYDANEKEWLSWNGVYWEAGAGGAVANLLPTQLAAQYLHAAAECRRKSDDEKAQALAQELTKRAQALGQWKRAKNVLEWMAGQPALSTRGGWDARPMLLPVENGVLNLETGELEPGRPADLLRKHAPTRWEGLNVSAPIFERSISEIMGKDPEMVSFLRRLFGYYLTGKATEHIAPILHGEDGRNGKGTLLETVKDVLGDELAGPMPAAVLVQANQEQNGEAPRPFLFALRGKRLVWASETAEGQRLNSALLKLLSGGDTITARTLHGKPDTFKATHKIMLLTNSKPEVDALDSALWERLLLIPFEQRFVDEPNGPNEHPRDKDLPEKLKAEAAGILAWLVRGCLEWQAQGLNPPAKVRAATKEYRDENDFYSLWEAAELVKRPELSAQAGTLQDACEKWCTRNGYKYSKNTLGKWLKKHYAHERKNTGVIYRGIGLRMPE